VLLAVIVKHMLNKETALDRTFHALADASRRSILAQLARAPTSVSDLARPLSMSLPAVMQHMAVLQDAGLVRSKKFGRVRTCSIEARALDRAEEWLNLRRNEWEQRFDLLGKHLATITSKGTRS
jgi:DNA-binding transcriptional ArsR family regulator